VNGGGDGGRRDRRPVFATLAAPILLASATFLVFLWVWGGRWRVAPYADEASYVFQAKIFASGHWSMPPRPIPEFFEQAYVLATPRVASMYFPGHAWLLVPGIFVGFPALGVLLGLAATGGILFTIARSIAGPAVALLAWAIWLTAPINPWLRPSYFCETSTTALGLAAWLLFRLAVRSGRRAELLGSAACLGLGFVVRPITMIAWALPLAVVACARAWRRRIRPRDLGLAGAVFAAFVALLPLWSFETTGDPLRSPYLLYFRQYTPWAIARSGGAVPPAERPLPPDLREQMERVHAVRRAYERTPRIVTLGRRVARIGRETFVPRPDGSAGPGWRWWRLGLLPLLFVGAATAGAEGAVAIATVAVLVLVHLPFWQGGDLWMPYYLDVHPIVALLTAFGLQRVISIFPGGAGLRRAAARKGGAAITTAAAVILAAGSADLAVARRQKEAEGPGQRAFRRIVAEIPEPKAIVFVRYGPNHNATFDVHFPLVDNEPDLPKARVWIVYDRGPDNARLRAIAPDRAPYLYDEANASLIRMPPAGAAALLLPREAGKTVRRDHRAAAGQGGGPGSEGALEPAFIGRSSPPA